MNKLLILIFLLLYSIKADQAFAQMENSTYILDTESRPLPKPSPKAPKQLQPATINTIKGDKFLATWGEKTNLPFSFSVSDSSLNFGEIKPGDAVVRTQIITVDPGSAKGFTVYAVQDHPLRSANKHEIPNTSCDNGNCTDTLFDAWSLPLTYGFGYRCENKEGSVCDAGINNNMYKRFSNKEAGELPALIMSSDQNKEAEAVIEYKINIPGNQPQEGYSTKIHLIATPQL